jgi:hypothetical protein
VVVFPVIEAMQLDKNNLIQNTQAIQESSNKKWFIDKNLEFSCLGRKLIQANSPTLAEHDVKDSKVATNSMELSKKKYKNYWSSVMNNIADKLLDSELRGFLYDVEKEFLSATANYKNAYSTVLLGSKIR